MNRAIGRYESGKKAVQTAVSRRLKDIAWDFAPAVYSK
jgi:hypothetical protein